MKKAKNKKTGNNLPARRSATTPEILLYQTEDGRIRINVRLQDETVWLTQADMAELFQTTKQNISLHLKNVFIEHELDEKSVVKEYLTTAADGKKYSTNFYNLDAILAVGYRVKSRRGTQFRVWATERLREYLIKGFTLDDERLKGGGGLVDYFDELLARIREIRASEARVYQRIREIFALASDYREEEEQTLVFYATMQNKMHYAAAGLTAAEIIRKRADAGKVNMGLTSWKGGRVFKRDVATAKNYLEAGEIDTLNRITVMFLDQAEFRAQRRQDICIRDWEIFLDRFLREAELPVLSGAGAVSHEEALAWAQDQYEDFAERRRREAERHAEERYLEDLRTSARTLEAEKIKLLKPRSTKSGNPKKPRGGKRGRKTK